MTLRFANSVTFESKVSALTPDCDGHRRDISGPQITSVLPIYHARRDAKVALVLSLDPHPPHFLTATRTSHAARSTRLDSRRFHPHRSLLEASRYECSPLSFESVVAHSVYLYLGILVLNLCLLLPLLSAWVNGLDSSMVNGLQILPDWQDYFHHPEGKILGELLLL